MPTFVIAPRNQEPEVILLNGKLAITGLTAHDVDAIRAAIDTRDLELSSMSATPTRVIESLRRVRKAIADMMMSGEDELVDRL